jgi:hypothetical protein
MTIRIGLLAVVLAALPSTGRAAAGPTTAQKQTAAWMTEQARAWVDQA